MSKRQPSTPEPVTTSLEDSLTGHVSRFQAFHGLACKSALELKLAKYLAGLEVNALYDLHEELHGETRGRPGAEEKTDSLSVISLESFLEQHLNVTARTARRYRNHFLSITSAAPQLAEKLNAKWKALALPQAAQALPENATAGFDLSALQRDGTLNADTVQELCTHADEWGLHEMFEAPQRDVTPPEPGEEEEDDSKKAKKAAVLKFWTESVVKRLDQEELFRLPPTALEAVLCKMEEASKKGREILAEKTAKKKGGRKS